MNEKIIFNENILTYDREYLINIKESKLKEPYMRITQIKKTLTGDKKQTIVVFEEDLENFVEKLQAALRKCEQIYFKDLKKIKKKLCLDELRKIYKNAHKPWSEKEDEFLEQLYSEKESIEIMSTTLGRSPGEIEIRICLLDLEEKYGI